MDDFRGPIQSFTPTFCLCSPNIHSSPHAIASSQNFMQREGCSEARGFANCCFVLFHTQKLCILQRRWKTGELGPSDIKLRCLVHCAIRLANIPLQTSGEHLGSPGIRLHVD